MEQYTKERVEQGVRSLEGAKLACTVVIDNKVISAIATIPVGSSLDQGIVDKIKTCMYSELSLVTQICCLVN